MGSGRRMRPFWTDSTSYAGRYSAECSSTNSLARSPFSAQIHPALTSFADEVCATIARLFAYVGTLALIAILAVHFWDQLPRLGADGGLQADWSLADHSQPAFALAAENHTDRSTAYTILRHPQGGRKDIFSWRGAGNRPVAELEIYQLGDEAASASPPQLDLDLRMPPGGELEAAGVVDSKFGTVALLWRGPAKAGAGTKAGAERTHDPAGCLGFFKTVDNPALRISGWSCQGSSLPAQRGAVACMLERLTLLTSGNEPKLAELFARAELNRRNCSGPGPAASGDWITRADNPRLRGPL